METVTATSGPTDRQTPLAAGFPDPVHDAQACFRAIMNAMARPGTRQTLKTGTLTPPEPLTPTAAAIALTLFDYDTPIWLDRALMSSEPVKAFLRFHTGAPIVDQPVDAAFALVGDAKQLIPLASFNQGSAEYPDESTTVILSGQEFGTSQKVTLSGPGIRETNAFAVNPVPPVFWDQVISNNRQFPRGIDLIFTGKSDIAALPRSTSIVLTEV